MQVLSCKLRLSYFLCRGWQLGSEHHSIRNHHNQPVTAVHESVACQRTASELKCSPTENCAKPPTSCSPRSTAFQLSTNRTYFLSHENTRNQHDGLALATASAPRKFDGSRGRPLAGGDAAEPWVAAADGCCRPAASSLRRQLCDVNIMFS